MKNTIYPKTYLLACIAFLFFGTALPCSMYKITANGKTMVGNNEDSWSQNSRIWFEQGAINKFGVAYVGYTHKIHPDGGMNEFGLAFDAFTMPSKENIPERDVNKSDFEYVQLKTIMQQCQTVDEVYDFLNKLNLQILNGSPLFHGSMLLFVDRTGKYLVVETDNLTFGNDDSFVLANFSFADTKDLNSVKMERYRNGTAFLSNKKIETSLSFCTALSDTMSVNRPKVCDGTLYTSIYDLENGLIYTYFFHDFNKYVSFNLKEELSKGDHSYKFSELFPYNDKYQKFLAYQTPYNNSYIFILLILCGILFFFSSIYYLISFLKSSENHYKHVKLAISLLGILLSIYMYILIRNQGIYYFPSPYYDENSMMVSFSSYLPWVLLLCIIPIIVFSIKIIQRKYWPGPTRWLLMGNNITYFILLVFFAYWDLFDIFS